MIRAAVLGSPISHSLSPKLHAAAYGYLEIAGEYSSFDVKSGTLKNFLADKINGWSGFSLTMPLKEEALNCADFIDPLVRRIKSGNTLVNSNGKWHLYSTDVLGFRNVWQMKDTEKPESVLIIGSGATARSAAAAFDSTSTDLHVAHRNVEREESMRASTEISNITFHPMDFIKNAQDFDLVINTTPRNILDEYASGLTQKPFGIFFDVIYDPWPTQFALRWEQLEGVVISGLELLVAQGIEQVRLFTGKDVPTTLLSNFLRSEFNL